MKKKLGVGILCIFIIGIGFISYGLYHTTQKGKELKFQSMDMANMDDLTAQGSCDLGLVKVDVEGDAPPLAQNAEVRASCSIRLMS